MTGSRWSWFKRQGRLFSRRSVVAQCHTMLYQDLLSQKLFSWHWICEARVVARHVASSRLKIPKDFPGSWKTRICFLLIQRLEEDWMDDLCWSMLNPMLMSKGVGWSYSSLSRGVGFLFFWVSVLLWDNHRGLDIDLAPKDRAVEASEDLFRTICSCQASEASTLHHSSASVGFAANFQLHLRSHMDAKWMPNGCHVDATWMPHLEMPWGMDGNRLVGFCLGDVGRVGADGGDAHGIGKTSPWKH